MVKDYEPHMCLVSWDIGFICETAFTYAYRIAASDDGYPFTGFGQRGALAWRPEPDKHDPGAFCQIHFEDCFASVREGEPVTLDGAFKRIAFDRSSQCGDCGEFVFRSLQLAG